MKKHTNNNQNSQLVLLDEQDSDVKALKSLFEIALATRNFEIQQLVHRNNFFMIFQGVLLAGVMQSSHSIPVVSFLICGAGLLVSICQTMMASGAKYWQEYWEAVVEKIEVNLLNKLQDNDDRSIIVDLFHANQYRHDQLVSERLSLSGFCFTSKLVMKKFSVSRTPIYVALGLSMVWCLLLLSTMRGYPPLSIPSFIVGFKLL